MHREKGSEGMFRLERRGRRFPEQSLTQRSPGHCGFRCISSGKRLGLDLPPILAPDEWITNRKFGQGPEVSEVDKYQERSRKVRIRRW